MSVTARGEQLHKGQSSDQEETPCEDWTAPPLKATPPMTGHTPAEVASVDQLVACASVGGGLQASVLVS